MVWNFGLFGPNRLANLLVVQTILRLNDYRKDGKGSSSDGLFLFSKGLANDFEEYSFDSPIHMGFSSVHFGGGRCLSRCGVDVQKVK